MTSRFKCLAVLAALGLFVAACSGSNSVDGPAVQEQPPATATPEEIVSSFSVNEVNPLTGCGPRDVASAREVVSSSGMQIALDVDGLARGELSFSSDPASAISNYVQLPLEARPDSPGDLGKTEEMYLAPWFPVPADYTSVDYWNKRSGLVDTTDEIARITDDLAEWASNLLSTMTIDDQRWVEEAKYVQSQTELEGRYADYRLGLTALAERRKIFGYAPAQTVIAPRPLTGVQSSSNEDRLYLSFDETEFDRFGNTLAVSNVEGSTDFRIIAAEPPGDHDPAQFVRGGRLDFASNGSEARLVDLRLAFGEGLGGSSLDKRRFTFGASIQFEPFPTVDPLAGLADGANSIRGNEDLTRQMFRYYFDQNNILQGGRSSGWISVGLNLRCQIEISLNSYPMDVRVDSHMVILVSERILNISHASQILLSVDSEAKEVMLTTGDGGLEAMITEVFDLPDDFRFSFDALTDASVCEEIGSCTTDPDEVENFLSMTSEDFQNPAISPNGLRGALDWMYLANGVLAPQDASAHLIALDLQESARAEGGGAPTFTVSPNGHVVSLALDPDEYKGFLDSDPTNRIMVIVQEAILKFGDNFDVVAVVPRDSMSELALGTDVARNYSVRRTPGTYNLNFVFPEPYAWGDPGKLRSVLIGASSAFMTTQTFVHEIAHTWGNDVVYPSGTPQYLIDGHFGVSSVNGYLGGFDPATLRSEGPGSYSAARFAPYAGLPESFADIELYLMGLLPATEIDDITMFVNVSDLEDRGDRTYFRAEGSEVITIDDIERLAGARSLEDDTEFEILYIVVSGESLGEALLADYDAQAVFAAELFSAATRGLATLSLEPVGR
jgi:hypothetical protein